MFPKNSSAIDTELSFVVEPVIEDEDVCQSCHSGRHKKNSAPLEMKC
jgi:hypothetical protein